MLGDPGVGAYFNGLCGIRVFGTQCFHATAQPQGVERIERKSAVAALRAADAAGQMLLRTARGIGEIRVDDLDQFGIAGRQAHSSRIAEAAGCKEGTRLICIGAAPGLSCLRRNPRMAQPGSTVMTTIRYRNAPAMIDWFVEVLGFERHAVYEGPGGSIAHAELTLGGGMIMLGSTKDDEYGRGFKSPDALGGVETRSAYIVVDDADAAYQRAVDAGATVVRHLCDTPYGSREFSLKDPEGHSWIAGTYDPWDSKA